MFLNSFVWNKFIVQCNICIHTYRNRQCHSVRMPSHSTPQLFYTTLITSFVCISLYNHACICDKLWQCKCCCCLLLILLFLRRWRAFLVLAAIQCAWNSRGRPRQIAWLYLHVAILLFVIYLMTFSFDALHPITKLYTINRVCFFLLLSKNLKITVNFSAYFAFLEQ